MIHPSSAHSNGTTSAVGRRRNRRLKCPYDDCIHEGTFHREYELQRHVRVKHEGKKPFQCPFPGCFNRTEVTSYARADKLTSHIRNVHARHAGKLLDCCMDGCTQKPLPFDLLGVHIWQAHVAKQNLWTQLGIHIHIENARALYAAASTAYRQCPLWRCAKSIPLTKFIQHLTTHTIEESYDDLEALESEGYLVSGDSNSRSQSELRTGPRPQQGHCSPSVQVYVKCPVCNQLFNVQNELQEHIDQEHLIAGAHKQHFIAWRRYARESQKFRHTGKSGMWSRWAVKFSSKGIECPYCQATLTQYDGGSHHIPMLANIEELTPYRRAILKLYPDFATHPIWGDLA